MAYMMVIRKHWNSGISTENSRWWSYCRAIVPVRDVRFLT